MASSDLWIHWLQLVTDRHSDRSIGPLLSDSRDVDAVIARNKNDQQKILHALKQVVDGSLRRAARFYWGLSLVARSRTLKDSLFAASDMLNRTFDIDMSPDCDEVPSGCTSLPIILMLVMGSLPRRDEDDPFVEVSCTSGGHRLVIAPSRIERGEDWPEISPGSNLWHTWRPVGWSYDRWDWLTDIASELANSHYSFTVRSTGPLWAFLIEFRS